MHKSAGFVPISIEAMQDAANVAGEVARLLAFGKDTLESAAFATGSGSGQPTGIITALTGGSSEVSAGTGGAFSAGGAWLLDEALPPVTGPTHREEFGGIAFGVLIVSRRPSLGPRFCIAGSLLE